jgi:nitrogen-specific signal transduction histidine kinase
VTAPDAALPDTPHGALRAAALTAAQRLEAAGQADAARELRGAIEDWWTRQGAWTGELARWLGVHHDINNALVGVRGNAQLLMLGPVGQTPGTRERLEVVLRESDRIREAAQRIHALKVKLTTVAHESESAPASHAA